MKLPKLWSFALRPLWLARIRNAYCYQVLPAPQPVNDRWSWRSEVFIRRARREQAAKRRREP